MTNTTQEEVTIVENQTPSQVITKTTSQVEPKVVGEAPQKVYEKKKTILRFNQIIWYILGLIEILLAFRFILKGLGANAYTGFAGVIYAITEPIAGPFRGIFQVTTTGNSTIEWSAAIAGIVYLCIAWGFIYLLDIIYPITPKDIETN